MTDTHVEQLDPEGPALDGTPLSPGAVALLATMLQTGQWYNYQCRIGTDDEGVVYVQDQSLTLPPVVKFAPAGRLRGTSPPERKTSGAAGYDLRICLNPSDDHMDLRPHEAIDFPTGWHTEIPEGYVGLIVMRSGMRQTGVKLANQVGVIDHDYRGEMMLCLENTTDFGRRLRHNARVAQLLVVPAVFGHSIVSLDTLTETERGEGGFGSTGSA